eukprot:scaffold28441_cov67-Skeletonema_dohrnii-CCMP3373.AAC.1
MLAARQLRQRRSEGTLVERGKPSYEPRHVHGQKSECKEKMTWEAGEKSKDPFALSLAWMEDIMINMMEEMMSQAAYFQGATLILMTCKP